MLTMYIQVETPAPHATHIKVSVKHRNKVVRLDVDPVEIKRGMIAQAFSLTSSRKSTAKLADMPRLAPKKLREFCESIKSDVMDRKTESPTWTMIREAATEFGVTVPETGILEVEIIED